LVPLRSCSPLPPPPLLGFFCQTFSKSNNIPEKCDANALREEHLYQLLCAQIISSTQFCSNSLRYVLLK
jgi:hypothetical protein